MFSKLKAIKNLRDQAKHVQNALDAVIVEGSSRGVVVRLNGNQQLLDLQIHDELLSDKTKLQNAIKVAFAEAQKKLQKELAGKMKDLGGADLLKNMGL